VAPLAMLLVLAVKILTPRWLIFLVDDYFGLKKAIDEFINRFF
jgi:hypothetical protein